MALCRIWSHGTKTRCWRVRSYPARCFLHHVIVFCKGSVELSNMRLPSNSYCIAIYLAADLNGYVLELLGAKGEICNLLPIARKLMMPEESIDRIVKCWKDEDQQLEKIVQFWVTKKDILEDHQALRQDLEGLQQG